MCARAVRRAPPSIRPSSGSARILSASARRHLAAEAADVASRWTGGSFVRETLPFAGAES
jgi:hypothetical protein